MPLDGVAVVCGDDEGARAVAEGSTRRCVTYGLDEGMGLRASVIDRGPSGTVSRVWSDGTELGELRLQVPGDHNVRNALAAIAVAHEVGVGFDTASRSLGSFTGVARRFQIRGAADGVTLIDDYAHHPTEIVATLASARERGWSRIIAVFQPHRYSRTRHLGAALGAALSKADVAVITDVYGAGEDPEPGITGKVVVDGLLAASSRGRAMYLPKRGDVAEIVAQRAKPGDLVMTIGAGDVTMIAEEILVSLAAREADRRIDR